MHSLIKSFCVVLAAISLSCASTKATSEGDERFKAGDFTGAERAYARAAEVDPENPVIQEKWKRGKVFAYLQQGRELVFADRDFEALEKFELAALTDPQSVAVKQWLAKTKTKISKSKVQEGHEFHNEGRYELATDAFHQALLFDTSSEDAKAGLEKIRETLDRELRKAEDYYLRGIRDHTASLLIQAQSNFEKAALYKPQDAGIAQRGKDVKYQIAEQKFLEAQDWEDVRNYGAALVGYRSVRALQPDYPGLSERIAAIEVELKVEEIFRRARNLVSKEQFDTARIRFEEARKLTAVEKTREELTRRLEELKERELSSNYTKATTFEQDGRFEEAVKLYEKVLQSKPDYQDTLSRHERLFRTVTKAKELYELGVKAEEDWKHEEAKAIYEEILNLIPSFRDVRERLEKVRSVP